MSEPSILQRQRHLPPVLELSFDAMLCVATGRPFHGREVRRGRVLYIVGEGQSDIYDRIAAWCIENEVDPADLHDWFRVVITPVPADDLAKDGQLRAFARHIATGRPFDVIVLDNVNRNMQGDENASRDMSQFVKGFDQLRRWFRCAVIVVHHTGWDESRVRGSSVLLAAVDASLQVKRVGKKKELTRLLLEHMRAAPEGAELFFRPARILVTDWDAEEIRDSLVAPMYRVCALRRLLVSAHLFYLSRPGEISYRLQGDSVHCDWPAQGGACSRGRSC